MDRIKEMETAKMQEMKETIEKLRKQLEVTEARLRRSDDLLSEGLDIIQDHSPGYTVFISEVLQHFGLEG